MDSHWILAAYMHAQYGRLEWFGHVILHIRMTKILTYNK